MANLHDLGEPVNDAERQVLRRLRDELDDSWHIASNFWIQQGKQPYECDALAVNSDGWAYLIETKGWLGRIKGNDAQWELPPLATSTAPTYQPNPVDLTRRKCQILADVLKRADSPLKGIYIAPLVVLVSDVHPDLTGRCASSTVLIGDMVATVLRDPRDYKKKVPESSAERVVDVLRSASAPIAPPSVVGPWELVEQIEEGPLTDVWSARARLTTNDAPLVRLKRYRLDPLLTGNEAEHQWEIVQRDFVALSQLAALGAAVPMLATPQRYDDEYVVVTPWPAGPSIASLTANGPLELDIAADVFRSLVRALASVHHADIIHRNLTPRSAHLLPSGAVVLTDFDYSRLADKSGTITNVIDDQLDQTYVAPEVAADPGAASPASDVWSLGKIALELFGVNAESADQVPSLIRDIIKRCLKVDASERFASAEIVDSAIHQQPIDLNPLFDGFLPNDEINERYVVKEAATGSGGLSRVYRVFDAVTDDEYAAKFIRAEFQHLIDPGSEYELMRKIPEHRGVVRPKDVGKMSTWRRGGRQYQRSELFLLTPWIDGVRLDRMIHEGLSEARAIEITLQILDAVGHLHGNNLLHRDIKPQNVIVEKISGQPQLVDFNVSGRAGDVAGTEIGTFPYRPPDYASGWDESGDLYAVAVVLCEMLAGKLQLDARAFLAAANYLPQELTETLDRALAADSSDRFADATEFASALRPLVAAVAKPRARAAESPFPELDLFELGKSNWNPYQSRLSKLFSQSSTSNSGTRTLDAFAKWAYVPTKIDRELVGDVMAGSYGLVLITGNAGDGKTAFIRMVEDRLGESGAVVSKRPNGNGSEVEISGHRILTNWDGSQDEGDIDNDDVLLDFLNPFRGAAPPRNSGETRLIAINEGILLDFLEKHADEFPWLDHAIRRLFVEEVSDSTDWLCLVNLNLRALTLAGDDDEPAIVSQLLSKFADRRIWEHCSGCTAFEKCYARSNAATLRDPVLGPQYAERVRSVLDVARLRRRLHITMRDLRSTLAYVVVGSKSCDSIVELVEGDHLQELLAGQMYNSIFAASDALGPPAQADDARRDRLLNLVGGLDVARTADPEEDGRLWVLGADALRPDPIGLGRSDSLLLSQLRDCIPQSAFQWTDSSTQQDLRLLHASLRRKLLLEREDPEWIAMLPYARLRQFTGLLEQCTAEDLSELANAISNSDGLYSENFSNEIATRLVTGGDGPYRSYVLHPLSEFNLEPIDRSAAARYVEYAPDSVKLSHRDIQDCFLEVDVDLHETLRRIRDGFTPSREEMRGAWLNLKIFKERLATLGNDTLLITGNDGRDYKAKREAQQIVLEPA